MENTCRSHFGERQPPLSKEVLSVEVLLAYSSISEVPLLLLNLTREKGPLITGKWLHRKSIPLHTIFLQFVSNKRFRTLVSNQIPKFSQKL